MAGEVAPFLKWIVALIQVGEYHNLPRKKVFYMFLSPTECQGTIGGCLILGRDENLEII